MNDKKIIIAIVLFSALVLGGAIFLLSGNSSTSAIITPSQNTKASIDQKTYDWGTIKMKDGNVSKNFVIKNTGTDVLKLTKVKTSCHCTKAQVIINGNTSPSFGMNTVSPWVGEVASGGEAQLNVVFDPAYHGPNGVGSITRYISVDTNDPSNPNLEFTLTANVTK